MSLISKRGRTIMLACGRWSGFARLRLVKAHTIEGVTEAEVEFECDPDPKLVDVWVSGEHRGCVKALDGRVATIVFQKPIPKEWLSYALFIDQRLASDLDSPTPIYVRGIGIRDVVVSFHLGRRGSAVVCLSLVATNVESGQLEGWLDAIDLTDSFVDLLRQLPEGIETVWLCDGPEVIYRGDVEAWYAVEPAETLELSDFRRLGQKLFLKFEELLKAELESVLT